MIYFLLSFLGVLIYSTVTRKRTEIWPLLSYSWRKFGEKVLQVPSEMAKGFSTHPIASLFIIGVGLGLCVISRNCEGMGILVKLILNDMFSVIALPSFLENLPWWQGPTNHEYSQKYLSFYTLHLFFLKKQSFFFDMLEVALFTGYFIFFLIRWRNLNRASKLNYLNDSSAVEMVIAVSLGKRDLFLTYHRTGQVLGGQQRNHQNGGNQEGDEDDDDDDDDEDEIEEQRDMQNQEQVQHEEIPEQNNNNNNNNNNNQQRADLGQQFEEKGGKLTCWSTNPIRKLFVENVSPHLKSLHFDQNMRILITISFKTTYSITFFDLSIQKLKILRQINLSNEYSLLTLSIDSNTFGCYHQLTHKIKIFQLVPYTEIPFFEFTLPLSFHNLKMLKLISFNEGLNVICSTQLDTLQIYQIPKNISEDKSISLPLKPLTLKFEQPLKAVIEKKGVDKIIFQGNDGLFSIFNRDTLERIYDINLFEEAVVEMIDNEHFAIQVFTKLFVMRNYTNPLCVAFLDYFRNIDFSLIISSKLVLFIHSSLYSQKSQFQLNLSPINFIKRKLATIPFEEEEEEEELKRKKRE